MPDGDLAALLREYELNTRVENGVIELANLRFFFDRHLDELLPDAFSISPPIGRSKAINLFRRALRDTRLTGPLSAEKIRKRAEELLRLEGSGRAQRYTLWSKFRARDMPHQTGFKLRWNGVQVRTVARLPSWLDLDEYFLNGFGRVHPENPHFYGYVILSCTERDPALAANTMLECLELVFGLANLYEAFGKWFSRAGRHWCDGRLWLGPYQFLFRGRASLANDHLWYNQNFDEDAWGTSVASMREILELVPRVRAALGALEVHPLKNILVKALLLMQEAFAATEKNQRLLRYWSALEQLYVEDGARDRSNQKVVNRAAFAEAEPRLARWTLLHISRLRNEYVHAGGGDHDLDALCQFMRDLLSRHLNHWIFEGGEFRQHHELLQYVDLPGNRVALQRLQASVSRRLDLINRMAPPQLRNLFPSVRRARNQPGSPGICR